MNPKDSDIRREIHIAIEDAQRAIKRLSDQASTVFIDNISLSAETLSAIRDLATWMNAVERSYRGNTEIKTRVRIELNPLIMGGKPVIRGTRIPVSLILDMLAEGVSEGEILLNYPRLNAEAIDACRFFQLEMLSLQWKEIAEKKLDEVVQEIIKKWNDSQD